MTSAPATSIALAGGALFDLTDPASWDGSWEPIARGLAHTCRFAGQTRGFYSVATHTLFVHDLVRESGGDRELRIAALLHDAHEAFYGDVTRPLKALLGPVYGRLTAAFDMRVAEVAGIDSTALLSPVVRDADDIALEWEGHLFTDGPWPAPGTSTPPFLLSYTAAAPAWRVEIEWLQTLRLELGGAR